MDEYLSQGLVLFNVCIIKVCLIRVCLIEELVMLVSSLGTS